MAKMQKNGRLAVGSCALQGWWQSKDCKRSGNDVRCRPRPPRRETDFFGTSPPEVLVKFSCGCFVLVLVPVLIVDVPERVLIVDVPVQVLIVDVPVQVLVVDVPVRASGCCWS
jgi:hypothetical protein